MDKIFEAIAGALGGSAAQTAVGAVNALIGGNINENFSERAEERAYARQLDMYQRMYHDNSPANKRAQLEEAGLNPALMYGGATSAGGGTVQTGSPVQGTVNTKLDLPNILEISQMQKQIELTNAQIANTEADAKLKEAQATNLGAQTTTEDRKRDIMIENMRQQGIAQWFENQITDFKLKGGSSDEVEMVRSAIYKIYTNVNEYSMQIKELNNSILKTEAETGNEAAQALLNNERAKGYFKELMIAQQNADQKGIEAAAKKLSAEWETGEFTNWKTWATLATEGAKLLTNMAGVKAIATKATKVTK